MTVTTTTEAPPNDGASFALPDHWSTPAREAVAEVLAARPDLAGADLGSLEQAAELVTLADALTAVARAAGYVSRSDAGNETPHRAVSEARLARTSAAAIFARLVDAGAASPSAAGRAMARRRWSR